MDYCGFEARLKDLRVAEMASLCWGDMAAAKRVSLVYIL